MGASKSSIFVRNESIRKKKQYHRYPIREVRLEEFDVHKFTQGHPAPGHHVMSTLDLRSGTHHRLHRGSHTPQELVERFLRDVADPKSEWTPRQMAALDRWEQWRRNVESFCRENSSNVPSEARMTELIQIIGDLFFFGKLSRCRFEWHKSLSDADTGETSLGLCCLPDGHSRDWFVIQMDSTDIHSLRRFKSHFTAFMSVLLHECVHGFFELYSCESTCQSEECSKATRRALGDTGHGEAWQIVASHVEALARRYLLKSVRIHVQMSLGVEFEKTGLVPVDEAAEALCHPYSRHVFRQFLHHAAKLERHIEDGSKKITLCRRWILVPASSSKCPILARALEDRIANEPDADFFERLRKLAREQFRCNFYKYAMKDNFREEEEEELSSTWQQVMDWKQHMHSLGRWSSYFFRTRPE